MPGSYFEVVGQLNPGHQLHIIQLKEIAPPIKFVKPPFSISVNNSSSSKAGASSASFQSTSNKNTQSTSSKPTSSKSSRSYLHFSFFPYQSILLSFAQYRKRFEIIIYRMDTYREIHARSNKA